MTDTAKNTTTEIPGAPRVLTEAPEVHQDLRALHGLIDGAIKALEAVLDAPQWAAMVAAFNAAPKEQRGDQGTNTVAAVAALKHNLMGAQSSAFDALYMSATLSYHNGGPGDLIARRTTEPAMVARKAGASLSDPLFALGVVAAYGSQSDTLEMAEALGHGRSAHNATKH
ncbi:hypothetical protein UFOVP411_35 [uncultured Caudovirales phage]|uniref:Uncharacterized protein n=1 Tax=uncultured Caudovirales phage TaxID=2100421 RepID=A0A6J5MBG7_9CAUD|nr:hypothetical protein UFOVP411_35 [uncultured Caudovirales phage]